MLFLQYENSCMGRLCTDLTSTTQLDGDQAVNSCTADYQWMEAAAGSVGKLLQQTNRQTRTDV